MTGEDTKSTMAAPNASHHGPTAANIPSIFIYQMTTNFAYDIISLLSLIAVFLAYRKINTIFTRQERLRRTMDFLSYTVSRQIFVERMMEDFLRKIGCTGREGEAWQKLQKDRKDFMEWYTDPRGISWREPSNMFEQVAADDVEYATLQPFGDPNNFFKLERGSATSSSPNPSVATCIGHNPNAKSPAKKPAAISSDASKSIRTSFTQPDDGLYENVDAPQKEPGGKKPAAEEHPVAEKGVSVPTGSSKSGSGRKKSPASKSDNKPKTANEKTQLASKHKTSSTSTSTSKRDDDKPETKTAYNSSGDGDYENLENLKLN